MKLPFYQLWLSMTILIALLFPHMIVAGTVSSEPSTVSKTTTTEASYLQKQKAQHLRDLAFIKVPTLLVYFTPSKVAALAV